MTGGKKLLQEDAYKGWEFSNGFIVLKFGLRRT
jgi:hypothetical protein